MALNLEQKKAIVSELSEVAGQAHSAVVAEYTGITVEQMTGLRKKARDGGVYLRVVKNTLARRAVEGTEFECMSEQLVGPLLYAFSMEDPGGAARLVKDFAKDNDKLVTRLVAIGGNLYDASELKRLADLPNREQALAMLAGLLQAPISKFVRTLAEPNAKLARTVAAIRDQKQAS